MDTDFEIEGDEESDEASTGGSWSDDDDMDNSSTKSANSKSSIARSFKEFDYSDSPLL